MTTNKVEKYAWLIRAIGAPIREALAQRDARLTQLEVRIQDLERDLEEVKRTGTRSAA